MTIVPTDEGVVVDNISGNTVSFFIGVGVSEGIGVLVDVLIYVGSTGMFVNPKDVPVGADVFVAVDVTEGEVCVGGEGFGVLVSGAGVSVGRGVSVCCGIALSYKYPANPSAIITNPNTITRS